MSLLIEMLRTMSLHDEYRDEERDLQSHIQSEIDELLERFGLEGCETIISVGGNSLKPHIDMLGTDFWPDIEIVHKGEPPYRD